MNRVITCFLLCVSITSVIGQFDFDKEVAGLFSFDRIPEKIEPLAPAELHNEPGAPTSSSPSTVFTAFAITPEPLSKQEELKAEDNEKIKDKVDVDPGFGNILLTVAFEPCHWWCLH